MLFRLVDYPRLRGMDTWKQLATPVAAPLGLEKDE